ncbi:NADP-dependent oxidoreductase domain-containing protein [Lipomyces oligophaga]|uniref:NADP-dependent oxidoreductase domain-containing protein n=1 Tax=Lipomyces oligophaga TaxID=45792 RepID=UPI0034CF74EA
MPLPTTKLGANGPEVTVLGYGAMGVSAFYGSHLGDTEAFAIFDKLVELGITFLDTARVYNDNEEVIGRWFKKSGKRDQVFLCSKFGFNMKLGGLDSSPEYIKVSLEESLARLGVDSIDLFYQHRMDPKVPIETVMQTLAGFVQEGKIKYIGLSECSADTLRRACKIHPVTAVQIEYSPFSVEAEQNGLFDACKELGVGVVAYSPLSRGMLTGTVTKLSDFAPDDWRLTNPRFSAENFPKNLALVDGIKQIADSKGVTPGQLTLAWIISQGYVPIPGTTKIERLVENAGAATIILTEEEKVAIRKFVDAAKVSGDRYSDTSALYADTPSL